MNEDSKFIDDVKIDKYSLDDECIDQPRRFAFWALRYANAVKERDEKYREKKVLYAEVEREVRANPDMYIVGKVTEAGIAAAIETDARIRNINNGYVTLDYNASVLNVAVESFRDRRAQIANLVQLYHDQYWADQDKQISREVNEHLDAKMTEDINTSLNKEV